MMSRISLFALLFAAVLPLTAHAVEYKQVQTDKSTLSFGYRQMGVSMDGRFRKFQSQLAFDPAKPAAAKISIDIDLASVDAGSSEANDELAGKAWFNTRTYPAAHFVSTGVKAVGNNQYQVAGKLTIKGRTQDIVVPASFAQQAGTASFDGSLQIRRADFAIGEGQWADFGTVANEVAIRFHLVATAGK